MAARISFRTMVYYCEHSLLYVETLMSGPPLDVHSEPSFGEISPGLLLRTPGVSGVVAAEHICLKRWLLYEEGVAVAEAANKGKLYVQTPFGESIG